MSSARRCRTGCLGFGCLAGLFVSGLPAVASQEIANSHKQVIAVRVPSGAIRVDGRLEDREWEMATPVTDFVQKEPVEGAAPTDRMEVRFVYDDTALYIGARMHSTEGGVPGMAMSRRDDGEQSEYLQIELDTYLDRRTAYMFGVTASGVRLDHYHESDNEDAWDAGFDPVWEAKTQSNDAMWTAELWVPFSQLRFNNRDEQIWGLNIRRWRPALNEADYWVAVPRTERGWVSRFGELHGLQRVKSTRRLELLPYVALSSRVAGNPNPANPFESDVRLQQRLGLDFKAGIGPNLTLEATANPDFGQIEADPAEVNLTNYETFFSERRPFFLEGSNLLHGDIINYFHSRRIGARPVAPVTGDYVDYPSTSSILGAAKLTGRLPSGTSVGALGAITGDEFARASVNNLLSRVRVAPRTLWGAGRVQREFGREGSTIGGQMTVVHRDLREGDPLAALLVRRAFTGEGDSKLRFMRSTYEATLSYGFSYVEGEPAAIERVQRSSVRYFQRPDKQPARFDPTRRQLIGAQFRSHFDKIGGRHWLWGGTYQFDGPEFETNDLGRLADVSDIVASVRLTYRETQPGPMLRSYSFAVEPARLWNYDRDIRSQLSFVSRNNLTWRNFWSTNLTFGVNDRVQREQYIRITRGGPSMAIPNGWSASASLRNSSATRRGWNVSMSRRENDYGDAAWGANSSLSVRPAPSWQLSVAPTYHREILKRQYVTTLGGGQPETFGRRYVFGFIDRTTLSMQARFNYTLRPDVTLDLYAEPFATSGRYDGFGELAAAGSAALRVYGEGDIRIDRKADGGYWIDDGATRFALNNADFNVRSFRSNVVLRWEWRPGSTFFVVWQQDRSSVRARGDQVRPADLFASFSAPGDNIFAVKTTLWIFR